jgi:hypothetical protein
MNIRKPRAYIADGSEHLIGVGAVFGLTGPDDDKPDVAGKLYVPDPEQRHGWREFYIHKAVSEKPGARSIGFGKPR